MIVFCVKITALLAAGFATAACLRSRSAAVRHLSWVATLVAALALAALVPVLPALAIPTPQWMVPAPAPRVDATAVVPEQDAAPAPAAATARVHSDVGEEIPAPRRLTAQSALVAAWLAGAVGVLAWWLLGHAGLARLTRRARTVHAGTWRDLLAQLRSASGLQRPVELRCSAEVGSPVVWGVRHPVILLPRDAESWSAERRRVVLAHELAHVARHDGVINALASAAAAVYWFHPLAWLALRRLRIESEHACDDRVLAQGTAGADYAAHLLDIARAGRALRLVGLSAIGMARPSHLEGRLLAMLDEGRARSEPGVGTRIILGITVALAVPLLAAARAVPLAPTQSTPRLAAAAAPSDPAIERTLEAADGERLTLDLESGARVVLHGWKEPRAPIRVHLGGPDADATRVDISRVPGGIRVHMWVATSGQTQSTAHALEIMAPQHYDLQLRSAGGDLSLSDLDGSFSGSTGGGRLTIERVDGEADLETGGGEIRVTDANLRGSVSTGAGMVVFTNVSSTLRGSSASGPVIHWDAGANDGHGGKKPGRLHFARPGGDIELAEILAGADLETGGGDIRIARARGNVTASTGGGDIDIARVSGGVKADTGAGTIRVGVDALQRDGDGVVLGSGHGNVVIELPAGVAATFDLEAAYTEGQRRKARIDSDWHLEQSESDTWDDSHGTPRKYVRAHGETGGGGPLVQVRTVNGDISVRRVDAKR